MPCGLKYAVDLSRTLNLEDNSDFDTQSYALCCLERIFSMAIRKYECFRMKDYGLAPKPAPLPIGPEFINIKKASKFLNISENALRITVCRGRVAYYKFGRKLRFKYSDLQKILKKKDVNNGNF